MSLEIKDVHVGRTCTTRGGDASCVHRVRNRVDTGDRGGQIKTVHIPGGRWHSTFLERFRATVRVQNEGG